MNFFASQEAARRQTRVLLGYYALAVVSIVCAFYLASRAIAAVALGAMDSDDSGSAALRSERQPAIRVFAWNSMWMFFTAGLSIVVIGCGTLYRCSSLSEGGASVALSAGGREIKSYSQETSELRLINVVQEMALASGISVPRIFVLDDEMGVNAFAAGFTPKDAAIAVTRGALERLRRDELQGVIAHEFSHILNGDMRLNCWLIGVLFGILVTSVLGRVLMESLRGVRVTGGKKGGGVVVLALFLSGLALWAIGSIGVFFARLIQCSVSRQREFLADASAVQFTRNPLGLAGALKRIGALRASNSMRCANRDELSHLLFASSSGSGSNDLFASHPPLGVRIRRLDPTFNGDYSPWFDEADAPASAEAESPAVSPSETCSSFAAEKPVASAHVENAAAFLQQMPEEWRESVSQPMGAAAVLYGLLLSKNPDVRRQQRLCVASGEGMPVAAAAERWHDLLNGKDRTERRMYAELAIAGCRQRDIAGRNTCIDLVKNLVAMDGAVSLFKFMLQNGVVRGLSPSVSLEGFRKLLPPAEVRVEAALALAALAYAGQPEDDVRAEAAWREGVSRATSFGVAELLPERGSCTLEALGAALKRLNGLAPLLKRELLTACSFIVRADGNLVPDEVELLRAIADALDMPLPIQEGQASAA